MSGQNRVVRLHHGRGHLRRWIDGKLKLGLLTVIHRQPGEEMEERRKGRKKEGREERKKEGKKEGRKGRKKEGRKGR